MAINVHYQPPMEMISQAAYRAGLGQFAQQQQAVAQRQQQIDLQRQEAEAANYLRQQQLAMAANAQQMQQARDQNVEAWRQQQFQQDAIEKQQQLALANDRNQAYLQQLQQNDPAVRAEAAWQQNTAQMLDKEVSTLQADLSKMELNPEGQQRLATLNGQLRSIQHERAKMRPGAYSEAIAKWMQDVESSSLEQFTVEPPTAESIAATNMKKLDDYNVLVVDSKGNPKVMRLQPPPSPGGKSGAAAVELPDGEQYVPFEVFARTNYATFQAMKETARKELVEEAKMKQGLSETATPPKVEDVMARVRENYDADMDALGRKKSGPYGNVQVAPPAGPYRTGYQGATGGVPAPPAPQPEGEAPVRPVVDIGDGTSAVVRKNAAGRWSIDIHDNRTGRRLSTRNIEYVTRELAEEGARLLVPTPVPDDPQQQAPQSSSAPTRRWRVMPDGNLVEAQ